MAQRRPGDAIRLNMARAADVTGMPIRWSEMAEDCGSRAADAAALVQGVGDVVLARRSGEAAYHLACVVDDAAQGITHVVRGADLAPATTIHVLLQRLLGLPTPTYHHHRLIRDEAGKRLAKRDDARAIAAYRDAGATPADLRRLTGLPPPPA